MELNFNSLIFFYNLFSIINSAFNFLYENVYSKYAKLLNSTIFIYVKTSEERYRHVVLFFQNRSVFLSFPEPVKQAQIIVLPNKGNQSID